ncbi:NAD(P)-dependent oxidoreductase [Leptospira sp. 96542]|nr:NAD(P)-dependent oxidoreductase [Leptospira sp. 96542]
MVSVLVTGASGFIGSSLVTHLENKGYDVFKTTRESGDISKNETWRNFPSADFVIHLASRSFVPDSWKDSNGFIEANVLGTSNALEFAKKCNAKLIYISAYLYGIPENLPISERHPILPNNPYALSKFLAENICKFHSDFFNQSVTILRLFNVYGPNQKKEFLIPSLIDQCLNNSEIRVLDLNPKRDYIYIDDVLNVIEMSILKAGSLQIYNVGSGISYSVQEIIDQIQVLCKTKLPVFSSENVRPQEILDVVADISLAKNKLGWFPKFGISDGLEKTIASSVGEK